MLYRLRQGTTTNDDNRRYGSDDYGFGGIPECRLRSRSEKCASDIDGLSCFEDEKGLDTLTRLTATRKEIDNLRGLEVATGLTDLDLGDNAIVDLGPLRNLTSLEELDLADNQIENVSPLSGLTSLTDLDLGDNLIVNVSLQNLSSLESLDLADNLIENVSSLPSLSGLETLDLRNNSCDGCHAAVDDDGPEEVVSPWQ